MKLVPYYRVSTKKQGASGLGLDAQLDAVASYAQTHNATVIAEFKEIESGKRSDRPELAKALAHAKLTGATLVVAKLDRLGRNVAFLSKLIESGVQFVACDNPHANTFTLHILAAVAEHEAKMISSRTKQALAQAKKRGVLLGATNPNCRNLTKAGVARGSKRGGKAMRERSAAFHASIDPIVLGLLAEGMSIDQAAEEMNRRGYKTANGGPWNARHVRRVAQRGQMNAPNVTMAVTSDAGQNGTVMPNKE